VWYTHQSYSLLDRSLISVGVFNYYLRLVCAWQVLVDKKIMTPYWQEKSSQNVFFLPSNEKWRTPIYTYVSDIYIKNKEKQNVYVYVKSAWCSCIKWKNNCDCSSRQTHILLFLWWKGVSYKTTNVLKENDDNVCSFIYEDDDDDYQQFYSLFIMFEWEPSSSL
jgi:hypothetical protein